MSTAAFDVIKQSIRAASPEELPAILGQLEEAKAAASCGARVLAGDFTGGQRGT